MRRLAALGFVLAGALGHQNIGLNDAALVEFALDDDLAASFKQIRNYAAVADSDRFCLAAQVEVGNQLCRDRIDPRMAISRSAEVNVSIAASRYTPTRAPRR